ncbi:RING-type E3 ubiquitin transferase C3H [Salix suchowensis]|nr:RING-type E3 ubiquitin transferase C3H [Salix suchowensis]
MSKRLLCKFFAHGACLKGEHCEFSHDWKDPPNNICTFYQKGICLYGSRCRYDHVKSSRPESTASSSTVSSGATALLAVTPELSASSRPFIAPTMPAWNLQSVQHDFLEDGEVIQPRNVKPADRSICSFAAAGSCPRGDKCPHIHGDLCAYCGKHCLHPFRPDERDEHLKACEKKQKNLDLLKYSQEIECSVCLDRVLSKPTVAERKFGLLSECDHPFCISCIRNWRSSSPTSGMDLSYFVIPSVIWYSSKEEKQEIVDTYKEKLRSIDCKHFDFGNGNCPFGTSCFYKHAYRDGRLEEVVLRHLGAEDGQSLIAKNIRLSDFLGSLQIRSSISRAKPRWLSGDSILGSGKVCRRVIISCLLSYFEIIL